MMKINGMILVLTGIANLSQAWGAPKLIELGPGMQQFYADEATLNELSEKAHHEGKCGGYMDVTQYPVAAKYIETPLFLDGLEPKQQAIVNPLLQQVKTENLNQIVKVLSSFKNRYYQSQTGVDAANLLAKEYERLAAGRSDVKVEVFKHSFKQPSVIARIAGSGPNKNEVVVVGGHIDSINQRAIFGRENAVAPGADDNASGTATVMEAFRILAQSNYKPNRTIEFMGYAGEEAGLLGSQDISQRYKSQRKKVVGVAQFDMTMYPGPNPAIVFMNDFVSPELTLFAKKLVDTYVKIKWNDDKCGYGCSDHASWTRAGYPAIMPFENTMRGMNPNIHTKDDVLGKIEPAFGAHFAKLAVSFAVELAEAK